MKLEQLFRLITFLTFYLNIYMYIRVYVCMCMNISIFVVLLFVLRFFSFNKFLKLILKLCTALVARRVR